MAAVIDESKHSADPAARGLFGAHRIVDLGVYLDDANYPPWGCTEKRIDHKQGAKAIAKFMDYHKVSEGAQDEDFPEEMGLAWSQFSVSDHAGNHIDAPYHFGPLVEGKPAKTIDQVPLEWCAGPGVRVDFRHLQGKDISRADMEKALEDINHELQPGDIILLWTGADEYIEVDADKYWGTQAGISMDALHYVLDHGVKLVGIDAWAMDVCKDTMTKAFAGKDDEIFFPAHFVGREREHMHLEKLRNFG
ncbi:MAG: cyclase family protein, partial [Gammaproteobacteria bacterium]